nr:hypothetical protein [Prevotella sp.]
MDSIVVLTHSVGCYYTFVLKGFPRTSISERGIVSTTLHVLLEVHPKCWGEDGDAG